jgi:phosphotransferase system enzyme I (PtsP)
VADRYDLLSAPALRFLKTIREQADASGLPLSICGEAAGRPLEAMALIGLGFRSLSMPATGIGLVKAMIRSMDASATATMLDGVLSDSRASLRGALLAYARETGIALG